VNDRRVNYIGIFDFQCTSYELLMVHNVKPFSLANEKFF